MQIFGIVLAVILISIVFGVVVHLWCKTKKDSETSFVGQVEVETWTKNDKHVWRLWKTESFDSWLFNTKWHLSDCDLKQIGNLKKYLGVSWICWKDTNHLPLPAELQDKDWLAKMEERDLLGPYGFKPLDEKVLR